MFYGPQIEPHPDSKSATRSTVNVPACDHDPGVSSRRFGCFIAATAYFAPASQPGAAYAHILGVTVVAMYLASGAPAFLLAGVGRAPLTALILALAFPAMLLLFLALV